MTKSTLDRRDVLRTAAAGAMGLTAGAHAAGVPPTIQPRGSNLSSAKSSFGGTPPAAC